MKKRIKKSQMPCSYKKLPLNNMIAIKGGRMKAETCQIEEMVTAGEVPTNY